LQLKAEVFPGDNDTQEQVQEWVDELIAQDCIALFEVPPSDDPRIKHFSGRKFWICVNWHHQKIDHPTQTRAPIRDLWLATQGISDAGRESFTRGAPVEKPKGQSADESNLWPQAILWARERFMGMDLSRRPQDRSLALKVCYLTMIGRLREEWLTEAVKSIKNALANPKKDKPCRPGALLMQIFKNKCGEAKPPIDFRRLLAECPDPPDNNKPAPPSPPPASSAAAVAVDVAALAGAAVKAPPPPDKKPAQSGAEIARQLRQLEAEDRRLPQQKNGQQKKSA